MTERSRAADADGERLDAAEQRNAVRDRYARVASESSCCGGAGADSSSGGAGSESSSGGDGGFDSSCHSDADREAVGSDAVPSLGCGNPTAIAGLEEGDAVLDLGAGGGFDCFLAAREVGPSGRVVGVDMTPEMVEQARENAGAADATNVEFRLGEMEHLPVADESVDVVVSNCAVNLSPDKPQVFREAYRVLRPGGRLAVSDVVATAELPADLRTDPASVAACVGGAASVPALESMLTDAGFEDVSVEPEADSSTSARDGEPDSGDHVVPASIEAEKPRP